MTDWEFTDSTSWGGKPIARCIADISGRCRVIISGTIVNESQVMIGSSQSVVFVLDDSTGEIDLLFVGQKSVSGMVLGAKCKLEGTAREDSGKIVVWNPIYEINYYP